LQDKFRSLLLQGISQHEKVRDYSPARLDPEEFKTIVKTKL